MAKKKVEVVEEVKETVTSVYEALVAVIEAVKVDVEKLVDKDNVSAGRRVRKAAQDIKAKAQQLRVLISEKVNEIKG